MTTTAKRESPFNGKWGINYSTDYEDYCDALEVEEGYARKTTREVLNLVRLLPEERVRPDRVTEEYFIDNEKGLLSRKVIIKGEVLREFVDEPFDQWSDHAYFDGTAMKFLYGREGDSDNMIVRLECGNNGKMHALVFSLVCGDTMVSTYTCNGRVWIKKFDRLP